MNDSVSFGPFLLQTERPSYAPPPPPAPTTVSIPVIWVCQVKLMLQGEIYGLSKYIYQRDQVFLLVTQTDVLIHHCFWKDNFLIVPAWMQVFLFVCCCFFVFSQFVFVLSFISLFLLYDFSFVFLSHLFPSANAQHYRFCGVQPLQPSGLQQLQTGREPKQQQSGNGMNINIEKTVWL